MKELDDKTREIDARLTAMLEDRHVPSLAQQLAFVTRLLGAPSDQPRASVESAARLSEARGVLAHVNNRVSSEPGTPVTFRPAPGWVDEDGGVLTPVRTPESTFPGGVHVRRPAALPTLGPRRLATGFYGRPSAPTTLEESLAVAFARQQANGGVLPANDGVVRIRRRTR